MALPVLKFPDWGRGVSYTQWFQDAGQQKTKQGKSGENEKSDVVASMQVEDHSGEDRTGGSP